MNVESWQLKQCVESGQSPALTEAISRIFGGCDCGYRLFNSNVEASFTNVDMGPMTIVRYFGQGVHWAERRLEHVRQVSSDDFIFYIPHDSAVTLEQRGHKSRFTAGEIGFVSTKNTFFGQLESAGNGSFEMTGLVVPGALLRSRFPDIDRLAGQAIDIGQTLHSIFSSYVTAIDGCAAGYDTQRLNTLSAILFDTLCSISDYALTTHDCKQPVPPTKLALDRIRTLILANLTDPDLSISLVAQRLNMSQRYVHNAFEGTPWTAKSWIKHRRLLECRKAIRSPSMAKRTITDIAFSWGFSDFSHFSRCYREKFGCSPKQDRPCRPADRLMN